jgi:predicted small metal-binding protein
MKHVACGDIIPGCTFTAEAETEERLLEKVAAHVRDAHGLEVTPELVAKVKPKVRDK